MEQYAAGEAAQAEIEPPSLLDLADALAAAVEGCESAVWLNRDADDYEVGPAHWLIVVNAARAYRASRSGQ